MPITVGAIRKLRADKRKADANLVIKRKFKSAVATMRRKPTPKNLVTAYSLLDRAAKTHILHENTASRLKSRLSRLLVK